MWKNKHILAFISFLCLSHIFWIYMLWNSSSSYEKEKKKYPYLSKRVLKNEENDLLIRFIPLRKELKTYFEDKIESYSMYFEYLPTGTSIGINEKREYRAASLFKVPVAMGYFHKQERLGIETADTPVVLEEKHIDKKFGTLWKQGTGSYITLGKALELSLQQSDNTASRVVADHVDAQDLMAIYDGLDLELQYDDDHIIFTTKHYSSILKALYFSSLLRKEHSNTILDMLSHSAYRDKLPAAIPDHIPVAHKIGVYNDRLYHDCGIFYVPLRPYVLCMIGDEEESRVRETMNNVSRMIYEYITHAES